MKSLCVSVFWPAWQWTWDPSHQWLTTSYAYDLAVRDAVKSRRLLQSRWFRQRWGPTFSFTGDVNQKSRYENDKTGYRLASSVGGQTTGEGGDTIIVDDPHKVIEAESDAVREGTLDWWDQSMSTRLNDPKTGAKVIIMQRVHERDVVGHVLQQMKDDPEADQYEQLILPAEYEPKKYTTSIGWSDPRTKSRELLWPSRFGQTEIANLKIQLGSRGAAAQLQQRPAPAEGGVFNRTWWRFWQPKGAGLPPVLVRLPDGTVFPAQTIVIPSKFSEIIQSWDMTFKETNDTDFVVGGVWARAGSRKFLLEQVRDRMDFPKTLEAVRAMKKRWPTSMPILIEDKANGPAVISTVRGTISGIIAVNPEGGKEARANAVSPTIEAGNVYLPHPAVAPWVWDYIEECAVFPNGAFDDQVDQTTQALVRLLKNERRDSKSKAPRSGSYRTG